MRASVALFLPTQQSQEQSRGGLISELLLTVPRIVGSTTCTRKGYEPTIPVWWIHVLLTLLRRLNLSSWRLDTGVSHPWTIGTCRVQRCRSGAIIPGCPRKLCNRSPGTRRSTVFLRTHRGPVLQYRGGRWDLHHSPEWVVRYQGLDWIAIKTALVQQQPDYFFLPYVQRQLVVNGNKLPRTLSFGVHLFGDELRFAVPPFRQPLTHPSNEVAVADNEWWPVNASAQ